MKGYREHLGVPGLYGFSVQYHASLSWQELARAATYPNAQVSVADDQDLLVALQPFGYSIRLVASPGAGYHHTFAVLYDATGVMLKSLPAGAAQALHDTFKQHPNPYRSRRVP